MLSTLEILTAMNSFRLILYITTCVILSLFGLPQNNLQAQTISTFPYVNNFSSDTIIGGGCNLVYPQAADGWINVTYDSIDWIPGQNSTASSNTGPINDHTQNVTNPYYLYLESSCSAIRNAYFESPYFDFTNLNNPIFTFWYHMHGQDIGTLAIEASSDSGATWTSLWSLSGEQQNDETDPWQRAIVGLQAYANLSSVKFRILGTTTNGFRGDIAVDDIEIRESYNNDAGIKLPFPTTGVVPDSLTGLYPVYIDLANYSHDTLTSVDIEWRLNGLLQPTLSLTGIQIPPYSDTSIELSSSTNFTSGWTYLRFWTSMPNGVVDEDFSNDTAKIDIYRLYRKRITGNIYEDFNLNCAKDSNDLGRLNILVAAIGGNSYYTNTDSAGNYTLTVDTGFYSISPILSHPYWSICNAPQNLFIGGDTSLDFGLQITTYCPFLTVDIGAPFIRSTGGGSPFTVSYCNNGTDSAQNAYVVVTFDSLLNVTGSSIPIAAQSGNSYTFQLGNLPVGFCGSFTIQAVSDTAALMGQTLCAEAHIYPDTLCTNNSWTGPVMEVNGDCQNNTVLFNLTNTGAAMTQPLSYYVYEDNVMFRTGNTNVLGVNGMQTISQPASSGRTYRIIVNQAAGFPPLLGDPSNTAFVEACNMQNGTFNSGFALQFSNGDQSPFVAIDCNENIGSFDPNDKQAQPVGYGNAHYILPETPLDYRIRFQNTGTDTAFTVLITDVISPALDLSTLEMGASSHDYTWEIIDDRTLAISFKHILLPDSNVNEPASHGFVRYRITPLASASLGTVINNTAAIYFDFNPPIITNTTFHTLGDNFITINLTVEEVYEETLAIKVAPNPFSHSTTLYLEQATALEYQELTLEVFDLAGRVVTQKVTSASDRIQLSRGDLQTGVYLYRLRGDGRLLGTGKIMVQ